MVQQRSEQKIVGAGQWANTLCANLKPGESHRQCLERRVFDELGVKWQKSWLATDVYCLRYQVACKIAWSENEIDHFFILSLADSARRELDLSLNPSEVQNIAWLSWQQLKTSPDSIDLDFTPWFKLFLQKPALLKAIDDYLNHSNKAK